MGDILFNKNGFIKTLRDIHSILFEIYSNNIDMIDYTSKEKLCNRAAYSIINKMIFIKICDDKMYWNCLEDKEDWDELVTNYSINQIVLIMLKNNFCENGLDNEDIYSIDNLKDTYIKENTNRFICEFQNALTYIKKHLYKEEYNFISLDRSSLLGDIYEEFMDKDIRRSLGQFYTPVSVIDYILKNTIAEIDIIENPFVSVLDPACGSGHFLLAVYDLLKIKFQENIEKLNSIYGEINYNIFCNGKYVTIKGYDYWRSENIHYHILKNCIYGADIDGFAVQLTSISLLLKDVKNLAYNTNIIQCDSLIKWEDYYTDATYIDKKVSKLKNFWSRKFDYIIGNPPYIGHKDLTKEYKKFLRDSYREVYNDKADISYCFIYRFSKNSILNKKISFITSRYFLESPTAFGLRNYINQNLDIQEIFDFYGVRILKDIGIDPLIFLFESKRGNIYKNNIRIIRLNYNLKGIKEKSLFNMIQNNIKSNYYSISKVEQENLDSLGWMLIPMEFTRIINKIHNKSGGTLGEICDSFQGVITGCDKAFIIESNIKNKYEIENEFVYKWIKNSDIKKYITYSPKLSKYILYIHGKSEINLESTNAYKYILKYKDKLIKRKGLENKNNWYFLHRARNVKMFTGIKIIFPYKSNKNIFSINSDSSFFSADVYGLKIKPNKEGTINYYTLLGILNSKLYDFYFKCFAKKLGDNLYDYYPNTVMRLYIPLDNKLKALDEYVENIINTSSDKVDYLNKNEEIINKIIENYFELGDKEIELIHAY